MVRKRDIMSTKKNNPSASQERVDTDFSADGVVSSTYVKLDDAIPLSVLLSVVQSDGSMFQFQ
jgi:hypothetical protein